MPLNFIPSKIIAIAAVLMGLSLVVVYIFIPNKLFTNESDSVSVLVKGDTLIPSSLPEVPVVLSESASERAVLPADGSSLSADGSLIPADGSLIPADGSLIPADGSLLELEAELASTVLKREDIEEALRVVELKVGALETQLDDIEIRGDNPADVQDETLDSFQAVFADYQDAMKAFEKIKAREDWLVVRISDIKK